MRFSGRNDQLRDPLPPQLLCTVIRRRSREAIWIHGGGSAVSAVNEASAQRAGEFNAVRDTAAVREQYPGVDHMADRRPPSL